MKPYHTAMKQFDQSYFNPPQPQPIYSPTPAVPFTNPISTQPLQYLHYPSPPAQLQGREVGPQPTYVSTPTPQPAQSLNFNTTAQTPTG